jgi:hypothetical protein
MNRRGYLKAVGVLSATLTLAVYGGPGRAADAEPITVLVTFHSGSGNTEKMAQGVADGAKGVAGTTVVQDFGKRRRGKHTDHLRWAF